MFKVRKPRPSARAIHRPALLSLARCRQRHPLGSRQPLAPPAVYLEPGRAIDAMHPFVIHDPPVPLEQDVQPPIPEASALGRVRLEPRHHRGVRRIRPSLIPPRRRAEPDHPTGSAQTRAARLKPPHRLAPSDRAHHLFATTALIKRLDVERLLGHDVFQPPVLVLDLLEPLSSLSSRPPYFAFHR
jgi:hypothetical protein